jgi:hypothetical protein
VLGLDRALFANGSPERTGDARARRPTRAFALETARLEDVETEVRRTRRWSSPRSSDTWRVSAAFPCGPSAERRPTSASWRGAGSPATASTTSSTSRRRAALRAPDAVAPAATASATWTRTCEAASSRRGCACEPRTVETRRCRTDPGSRTCRAAAAGR